MYNGPYMVIRLSVCVPVAFFLYIPKSFSSSVIYLEIIYLNISSPVVYLHTNLYEKYNKTSSKIYKHLLQRKVQQNVPSDFGALFTKLFVFKGFVEFLYQ